MDAQRKLQYSVELTGGLAVLDRLHEQYLKASDKIKAKKKEYKEGSGTGYGGDRGGGGGYYGGGYYGGGWGKKKGGPAAQAPVVAPAGVPSKQKDEDEQIVAGFAKIRDSIARELDTRNSARANGLCARLEKSAGLSWAIKRLSSTTWPLQSFSST